MFHAIRHLLIIAPIAAQRQALPAERLRSRWAHDAVTDIIERGYGKTFYFHHPNGIRLQIELKTKLDENSLEGDPDPVPYVRELLQRG